MGMFDSVYKKCSCGATVEWQSKAGECIDGDYSHSSVPTEIAKDIDGVIKMCKNCGTEYRISIAPREPIFVRMIVREV